MLKQLFFDRSMSLIKGVAAETTGGLAPRAVLVYPHELTQVDNVVRLFESIANDAWIAGRLAALRLVVNQAEHCASRTVTKTILNDLAADIRNLERE